MQQKSKSLVEIHIAVLLFGLAGLFGKFITLPAVLIVFGRVFFATIALSLFIKYSKQNFKLANRRDYLFMSLLGVILAIHWTTFFYSVQISTVAIGLLTFSTFPVFTTFLEPYVFKEKIKSGDIVIAFITLLGVGLIIPKFELGNNVAQGAIWGIISGFTFAILSILNRKYVKRYSNIIIAFYQDAIATVILFPFLFFVKSDFNTINILLLILLGVVFTAVSHSLFINGMLHVKAQLASIIASLEPVYGIIFAALLLNEIPSLRTLLGGAIILGATIAASNDFSSWKVNKNRASKIIEIESGT